MGSILCWPAAVHEHMTCLGVCLVNSVIPWKKIVFLPPGSYWLHIASWLELGLCLLSAGVLWTRQDRSFACCHSPCEFKWTSALLCLENAVSWSCSSPLAFYSLSTSSSTCVSEPWGEGFTGPFLLGLGAPNSHSQCCPVVGVRINYYLLQEIFFQQCNALWLQQYVVRNHLISMFFWQNNYRAFLAAYNPIDIS